MNENDGLKPNDAALRLFFEKDTLYINKEDAPINAESKVSPSKEPSNENPATLQFEGGKNPKLLFLFSHSGEKAMDPSWGEMINGLLYNEKAMNMKKEDIALVNMEKNPSISLQSLLHELPAKKILVWGNLKNTELASMKEFDEQEIEGKPFFKVLDPMNYMEKDGKIKLWLFIKSKLLA